MKKISCGILIINEKKQLLMGHVTGQSFFDIPKGTLDEDESPLQCAIRECGEETSLVFTEIDLQDIGLLKYNTVKDLYLFKTFIKSDDVNIDKLVCNSFFEHFASKKLLPEVDGFKWVDINNDEFNKHCAKSMAKVLIELNTSHVLQKEKIAAMKNKMI